MSHILIKTIKYKHLKILYLFQIIIKVSKYIFIKILRLIIILLYLILDKKII